MTDDIEQLSCQELVELVTDYLEGVLPEADRDRLEQHLDSCDGCRDYIEQMRTTIALTADARPVELGLDEGEALLAAFREWKTG